MHAIARGGQGGMGRSGMRGPAVFDDAAEAVHLLLEVQDGLEPHHPHSADGCPDFVQCDLLTLS